MTIHRIQEAAETRAGSGTQSGRWRRSAFARRFSFDRALIAALFAVLPVLACNNMDDWLDNALLNTIKADALLDQGYVYVDDTGNIEVVMNNLEFETNPLWSQLSFISVWVYRPGANVYSRCCTGSSSCPATESNACLLGVGFSHDLGFTGTQYLNLHPPQAFNRFAPAYYMPVFVAEKDGRPSNFQGDYQDFSSPVNAVGDRELFDLYVGVFYSWIDPATRSNRVLNGKTNIGNNQEVYQAVSPDYISPRIRIETRFFRQSRDDPPGSVYALPHLASWTKHPGRDPGLFFRNALRINEIGSYVNEVTENDFVEIYNPTGFSVPLENVYLVRWVDNQCDFLPTGALTQNLGSFTIPPGGYLTFARSGHSLSNIDATLSGTVNSVNDYDCWALTLSNNTIFSVSDSEVIDFVGMRSVSAALGGSGDGSNQFEGSGPAPSTIFPASVSISRCSDGVDTDDNGVDFRRLPATPGASNRCDVTAIADLSAGQVLISEVNYEPNTGLGFEGGAAAPACDASDDEFYEIYNNSSSSINLAGATIQYGTSAGNFNVEHTFGDYVLAAGERVAVISRDAGCYTTASLSGRNVIFRNLTWSLSASGATFAIVRDEIDLPDGQTGPAINAGSTIVLDYMGSAASSVVFETAQAADCSNVSSIRTTASTDTNNNSNDFSCGGANGTPGQ
ncbi:MAG: lamin tail domain-containing protein [Spirochaetales bacterium]|nr:lamin tail domain-containing protein [Leptospiraceae bacterium]MCP5482391.1 lamin tail domain-containing protein [Spirochaetales bacterium]